MAYQRKTRGGRYTKRRVRRVKPGRRPRKYKKGWVA